VPIGLQSTDLAHLPEPKSAPLLAVVMLGIFSTAIATIVYFRLVNSAGPTFVSQLSYFIPLWAVVVGVVFLDETLEPGHLYALLLILGGIVITQLRSQRSESVRRQTSDISI
jgi:drug/metabolite transporter (DMT)-like permease